GGEWAAEHQRSAGLVLLGPLRAFAGQVVGADAGVGVEHRDRLRLGQQMLQDQRQRRVLEDVRVVAGVEDVPVVHQGFGSTPRSIIRVRWRRNITSVSTQSPKPAWRSLIVETSAGEIGPLAPSANRKSA